MGQEKILIELSGENYLFAEGEAKAISEIVHLPHPKLLEEDLLLVECSDKKKNVFHDRMGLAHNVTSLVTKGKLRDIDKMMRESVPELERRIGKKTFAVRTHKLHLCRDKKALRGLKEDLGQLLSSKQVDLKDPDVLVDVWIGRNAYIGTHIGKIDRRKAEERKVDKRPFFSPISIHPKMARAMINLARLRRGKTLYDPFCGTGGVLIEAGALDVEPVGSDIRDDMVQGTKQNLAHYDMEGDVFVHDVNHVLDIETTIDAVVTDPPYGRSTKMVGGGVSTLVNSCFERANELLSVGRYLIIVLPDNTIIPEEKENFVLTERYELPVHGSLTRIFCVYKKK